MAPEGYWGDKVEPEKDDWDLWLRIEDDKPDEPTEEEEADLEETFEEVEEIIDEIGPAAILEAVYQYMVEMPKPFGRIAKKVHQLADRCSRMVAALEEARQTRRGK